MVTAMKAPPRSPLSAVGLVLGLFLASGCTAPWPDLKTCPEEGCPAETDTDATSAATTVSSVTIDPNSSGGSTSATGSDTDATDSATTDTTPAAPPAIESFSLSTRDALGGDSIVIYKNGPIFVDVEATDAEGVRVQLDNGVVIELGEEAAGVFRGEFPIVSALANGDHVAMLVPHREDYGDGEAAAAPYVVELPPMGDELVWDVDQYLGEGWVVDVEILPSGRILELLTLQDDNNDRTCALRRRNSQGAYNPSDDIEILLNGDRCEAVDLAVRDGQVFVLLTWTDNDGRWWLGHTPEFDEKKNTILAIANGEPDETATALDLREDGATAVCGTIPSGFGDSDAFAWVWESGKQPTRRVFDYVPEGADEHSFGETQRDCLFVGDDRLVLVGEAFGRHDPKKTDQYLRRFFLSTDLSEGDEDDPPSFIVAPGAGSGNAAHSVATSADIDEFGRLLLTGYTCDEQCENLEGHLWVQSFDGTLDWFAQLGLYDYPYLAPSDVRWHPAGYVVVANGGTLEDEHTFMLRAFSVNNYEPLWAYSRSDPFQEHFPLALTVGPYGEICAGGFGGGIYPGLACVGS